MKHQLKFSTISLYPGSTIIVAKPFRRDEKDGDKIVARLRWGYGKSNIDATFDFLNKNSDDDIKRLFHDS